jgi:SAM-dependent methyltransferase
MVWAELRSRLGRILPQRAKHLWRRRQIAAIRRHNRERDVAEIFTEVYGANRWGGENGSFHSGSGSTSEHAEAYARVIKAFIKDRGVRHVVDCGCGDFRIGALLIDSGVRYTGIDIVASLIDDNRQRYGDERVRFECLNIIKDELPQGDLCLIRQVLQHLSNEQIAEVLKKADRYPYVIVTEHYPAPGALREKNVDKPCGEDVRIYDESAVFLDAPPFHRPLAGLLLDVDAGRCLMHPGERIRSYLIENPRSQADPGRFLQPDGHLNHQSLSDRGGQTLR